MPNLDFQDIQGNVLLGYKFPHVLHLFGDVHAGEPSKVEGFRVLISELLPQLTRAEWPRRPDHTINLGLGSRALAALQPALAQELASHFQAFSEGMPSRAGTLGDGAQFQKAVWEARQIWISIHATSPEHLHKAAESVRRLAQKLGLSTELRGDAIVKDGNWHEPFGFRDDISYPAFLGIPTLDQEDINGRGRLEGDTWVPLKTGEFLLGYENENEVQRDPLATLSDNARRLLHNATFGVFRHLQQHVEEFHRYLEETQGARAGEVAACMMGRKESGEPLIPVAPGSTGTSSQSNFDYRKDEKGAKCPLGAHVRRVNPRSADGRHRLIRRGIPYRSVPEFGPSEREETGLWFVAFNASIEDQFEFIQKVWCNGTFGKLSNARDPIVNSELGRAMAIEGDVSVGRAPRLLIDLPRFVTCHGGQYYLYPGLAGLELLCSSAPQSTPLGGSRTS